MENLMCDYSLESVQSRPAKVGDKLVVTDFGTMTRGFASVEDRSTAVCLLPGTELAFARPVQHFVRLFRPNAATEHTTAVFRQIDTRMSNTHHDALEFPDGKVVLLTRLAEDQQATVLQLPAEQKPFVPAPTDKIDGGAALQNADVLHSPSRQPELIGDDDGTGHGYLGGTYG